MLGMMLNDGEGRILTGETEADLIAAWNASFMNQIITPDMFRQAVAHRAHLWTGTEIAIDGTAADFLAECVRAGLVTMVDMSTNIGVRMAGFTPAKG